NESLVLARDPFGKKPLFYLRARDDVVFASELGALAVHPAFRPEIDATALGQYLQFKYVPGPATLIAGVRALPPGHFAVWRHGHMKIARHYQPPLPELDPARRLPCGPETVGIFRKELAEAVRL